LTGGRRGETVERVLSFPAEAGRVPLVRWDMSAGGCGIESIDQEVLSMSPTARVAGAPGVRFALILVAAGAVAAALVFGSSASAQAPTTLRFKELSKGSTFAFVDNAPKSKAKGEPSASVGDLLVFTNPLVDAAGKRIGSLYVHCTAVVAARQANEATYGCEGSVGLRGGTLTIQVLLGPSNIDATVTATVTGGTGVYANARGVAVSKTTKTGADDTVTLAG
jgi:hypothetical protein